MKLTLLRALALGLVHGALYGAVISWLHLRHNGVASIGVSLASLVTLVLLYGVSSAAIFVPTAVFWRVARSDHGGSEAGFFVSTLIFWELALLYGLTYGQTVGVTLETPWAMTLYLFVAALLIAVACGLATLAAMAAMSWLSTRRLLFRFGALAAISALAVHLVTPLLVRGVCSETTPRAGSSGDSFAAIDVEPAETGVRVVVVGLDGLDPRVLGRLRSEGHLPHFDSLSERGVGGELATLPDANSSVIWASIYSGAKPSEHGVLDFYRVRLPGTGIGLFPVHRTFFKELTGWLLGPLGLAAREPIGRWSLKRFPYWEIADHFGLSIGVVDGYLYSNPALVPDTEGSYFLSYGLNAVIELIDRGQLSAEVLPLSLQPVDLLPPDELPRADDFDWQGKALLWLLREQEQPKLVSFYAHQPDAIQHQYFKSFEPGRYFRRAAAEKGEAITEMHRRFDRFLGDLEELVDEQTAVLVVSDHGHSPTLVHAMDTQHRHGPPGAMLLFGGPFKEGITLSSAHIYDVFPTVLYLLGLPVAEDIAGRVLVDALDDGFVERWPIRRIPSYEGLWQPTTRGTGRSRELNQLEIEKLKAMGYL